MTSFAILLGDGQTTPFSELEGVRGPADAVGFPRQLANGSLTFRRSPSRDRSISDWHMSHARKNGSIIMYDASGKPVTRWKFTNGWPMKWERVPSIGGLAQRQTAASPVMEEMTLAYEHIVRV